eukprot:3879667-Rhodomonas_salina.2
MPASPFLAWWHGTCGIWRQHTDTRAPASPPTQTLPGEDVGSVDPNWSQTTTPLPCPSVSSCAYRHQLHFSQPISLPPTANCAISRPPASYFHPPSLPARIHLTCPSTVEWRSLAGSSRHRGTWKIARLWIALAAASALGCCRSPTQAYPSRPVQPLAGCCRGRHGCVAERSLHRSEDHHHVYRSGPSHSHLIELGLLCALHAHEQLEWNTQHNLAASCTYVSPQ